MLRTSKKKRGGTWEKMRGISGAGKGGRGVVKIDRERSAGSTGNGGKLRVYCRIHEPLHSPLDTVAHCLRRLSLSPS